MGHRSLCVSARGLLEPHFGSDLIIFSCVLTRSDYPWFPFGRLVPQVYKKANHWSLKFVFSFKSYQQLMSNYTRQDKRKKQKKQSVYNKMVRRQAVIWKITLLCLIKSLTVWCISLFMLTKEPNITPVTCYLSLYLLTPHITQTICKILVFYRFLFGGSSASVFRNLIFSCSFLRPLERSSCLAFKNKKNCVNVDQTGIVCLSQAFRSLRDIL